MNDMANEQAENEQPETVGTTSEDGIEELTEGDDAAEAPDGTGIELIANAITPLTIMPM
jgi:hypothetical protein